MAANRNRRRRTSARSRQEGQKRSRLIATWVAGVAGTVVAAVLAGIATGWLNKIPGVNPDTSPTVASSSSAAEPGEPFTTNVTIDVDDCSTNWYVPKAAPDIDFPRPTPKQDGVIGDYGSGWDTFSAADDGIPASPSSVFLSVQGKTSTAVVLNRLEIRIVQRRPAPVGTILDNPCGGEFIYRWLAVDLDQNPPKVAARLDKVVIEADPPTLPQNRQPIRFPYKVSSTDPEVFKITAETVKCDCEWIAVLSWQSAGRNGTKIINNLGKPFRTVGRANARYQCDGLGIQCVVL